AVPKTSPLRRPGRLGGNRFTRQPQAPQASLRQTEDMPGADFRFSRYLAEPPGDGTEVDAVTVLSVRGTWVWSGRARHEAAGRTRAGGAHGGVCAAVVSRTRLSLLDRIDPIGECVAMEPGVLADVGPAANRITGRHRAAAVGRDVLPGVVTGDGRE